MNLQSLAARARTVAPGVPSPRVVWCFRRVVRPLVRVLFRPSIEGLEHVPREGPFLLVANHSGALAIAEVVCLAAIWIELFGASRPLAGFAHPFAFAIPGLRSLAEGLGVVPSTYEAGERTLAAGTPLLVFPGGDHEAGRPFWRADRVDFGGRVGFLRMARRAGVSVVPLGIRGSHNTAPVLWQSRVLAWLFVLPRLFRVKQYPLTLLAVAGAAALALALPGLGAWRFLVAALWLGSPLALLPWVPLTIRFRIGPPLAASALFADDDASLAAARDRVEAAVQALVLG
jgi:1-acyl-sn-glycerol-3-phosphate acyltransferase